MYKGMFWSYSIVFVLGFAVKLYAEGVEETHRQNKPLYCVELKDGIPVLTSDGKPVLTEVTLASGIKIKTNGTVVKKDGTEFVLKNGECVNDSAEISKPGMNRNRMK